MVEYVDEAMPLSNNDLGQLLEEIKSSEVLEERIQLLEKLGALNLNDTSERLSVVEFISNIWEDFTCLDISQCRLNLAILVLAEKYSLSNVSECLLPYMTLLIKCTEWSKKHLTMSLMSTGENEEDIHSEHFFQLLVTFLTMSVSAMMNVTSSSFLNDVKTIQLAEKFVDSLLSFVKNVISEIKRINSLGSEILKAVSAVIDSVIKLWKKYSMDANWDDFDARLGKDQQLVIPKERDLIDHWISITDYALKCFCEIGVLAAKDGGRLVNVLNVSWKGVLTILQEVKGKVRGNFDIQEIMISLISLVKENICCAAESCSSSSEEIISASEARRMFLPIKFYIVHLIKIFSFYANEACKIRREITILYTEICTFRTFLSSDKLLYTTCEVFSDLLETLSSELILCLLNSNELKLNLKSEILDSLFPDKCGSEMISTSRYDNSNNMTIMIGYLSGSYEDRDGARILLVGRVIAFYFMVSNSLSLVEPLKQKVAEKLVWFFNTIIDEEVYSFILDIKIFVQCGSVNKFERVWMPMFSVLMDSLKAFMIMASSSSAWATLEEILVENLFHPHFLCYEIVLELWRFFIAHAEPNIVKDIFNKLCSIMKLITHPRLVCFVGSPLRKLARTVCWLLCDNNPSFVDYVYILVVDREPSQIQSIAFLALLFEGFPLNSLSENIRVNVKQKMISDYFEYIETFGKKLFASGLPDTLGLPILALSAALNFQQVSVSDTEMKTIKLLLSVIQEVRTSTDKPMVDRNIDLLNQALTIFSFLKHLYESDHMEAILFELKQIFLSDKPENPMIHQCKPSLALFMGGLGYMDMEESINREKCSAVSNLYHLILRERHWALAHLAIASFGSFAARTSCNQLWRFVPENAALAYDIALGTESNEDIFMSELKIFLEKERALDNIDSCREQRKLLLNESFLLREHLEKILIVHFETLPQNDESKIVKKRKLSNGISKGMELLQNGMKVIEDEVSQLQTENFGSSEIHEKFLSHLSCLEDIIGQLLALTKST